MTFLSLTRLPKFNCYLVSFYQLVHFSRSQMLWAVCKGTLGNRPQCLCYTHGTKRYSIGSSNSSGTERNNSVWYFGLLTRFVIHFGAITSFKIDFLRLYIRQYISLQTIFKRHRSIAVEHACVILPFGVFLLPFFEVKSRHNRICFIFAINSAVPLESQAFWENLKRSS